jgi:arabinofuranosyltransferase
MSSTSPTAPDRPWRIPKSLWLIVALFLVHAWYLNCVAEDAFISLRFAKNLASGHGLVWNVGEPPVEGYTDFLWVILCAAAMRVGIDGVRAAQMLGITSGVALIVLTYLGGKATGWSDRVALVPPALLAAAGPLATWSTSGMEMVLFATLVFTSALLVAAFWRDERPSLMIGAAAVLLLATLARPEGAMIAVILFGASLLFAAYARPRLMTSIAAGVATFAVLFAAYFAWRYHRYHDLLPNTYYAKTGGGLPQVVRGAMLAFIFYMQFAVPLLPWGLVALWEAGVPRPRVDRLAVVTWLRRWALVLLGTLIVIAYTLYTIAVGGDYMAMHRFYVPVLPFVYLCVGACAAILYARQPQRTIGYAALLAVSLAGTFFPSTRLERGFFTTPPVQHGDWRGVQVERWHVARLTVIGRFFNGYRREYSETLATSAIGAIGYYADMRVDDVHGLVDPHIAHLPAPADFAKHRPGHGRTDLEYSFDRRPTYFMFPRDLTPTPVELWRYVPESLRDQVNRDYVHRSVWLVDPVNGEQGYFTFFERRDSAAKRSTQSAASARP